MSCSHLWGWGGLYFCQAWAEKRSQKSLEPTMTQASLQIKTWEPFMIQALYLSRDNGLFVGCAAANCNMRKMLDKSWSAVQNSWQWEILRKVKQDLCRSSWDCVGCGSSHELWQTRRRPCTWHLWRSHVSGTLLSPPSAHINPYTGFLLCLLLCLCMPFTRMKQ